MRRREQYLSNMRYAHLKRLRRMLYEDGEPSKRLREFCVHRASRPESARIGVIASGGTILSGKNGNGNNISLKYSGQDAMRMAGVGDVPLIDVNDRIRRYDSKDMTELSHFIETNEAMLEAIGNGSHAIINLFGSSRMLQAIAYSYYVLKNRNAKNVFEQFGRFPLPIIYVSSQFTFDDNDTDAGANIKNAIRASLEPIGGRDIYTVGFTSDKKSLIPVLLSGTKSVKIKSQVLTAFTQTGDYPYVARFDDGYMEFVIDEALKDPDVDLDLDTEFSGKLKVVDLDTSIPGRAKDDIEYFYNSARQALLLRTTGPGDIPESIMPLLKRCIKDSRYIVYVSNLPLDHARLNRYPLSEEIISEGAIPHPGNYPMAEIGIMKALVKTTNRDDFRRFLLGDDSEQNVDRIVYRDGNKIRLRDGTFFKPQNPRNGSEYHPIGDPVLCQRYDDGSSVFVTELVNANQERRIHLYMEHPDGTMGEGMTMEYSDKLFRRLTESKGGWFEWLFGSRYKK